MKLQLKTLLFVFLCFSLITVFLKNTDYSFAKEGDSNNEFEEDSTNFYRDESILKAEADDSSDDEIKDSDSDDSKDLLVNDLVDVSQSVSDIKNSALETKVDVIDKFEKGISKLIQEIENSLPREVGRIERLNKLIESERIYVLKQINDTFSESNVVEDNKIDDLNIKIEEALKRIKKILEENSGEKVEIDNVSGQIKNSLEDYNDDVLDSEVERERLRINMLYEDSDDDKVSDYDEVHIYGTDPNNSKTVPGDLLDGDKILLGATGILFTGGRWLSEGARFVGGKVLGAAGFAYELFRPEGPVNAGEAEILAKCGDSCYTDTKLPIISAAGIIGSVGTSFEMRQPMTALRFSSEPGVPINLRGKLVKDIIDDLKSGKLTPKDLPVGYAVANGHNVVLNNKSFSALRAAGMEPLFVESTISKDVTKAIRLLRQSQGIIFDILKKIK